MHLRAQVESFRTLRARCPDRISMATPQTFKDWLFYQFGVCLGLTQRSTYAQSSSSSSLDQVRGLLLSHYSYCNPSSHSPSMITLLPFFDSKPNIPRFDKTWDQRTKSAPANEAESDRKYMTRTRMTSIVYCTEMEGRRGRVRH